jgi:hypothetical protein
MTGVVDFAVVKTVLTSPNRQRPDLLCASAEMKVVVYIVIVTSGLSDFADTETPAACL